MIDEPDLTFGSLLDWLIANGFQRVETLAPDRRHRFYTECKLCGGTDEQRNHPRTTISGVNHTAGCELATHLPRLRALANEGVTTTTQPLPSPPKP